MASVYFICSRVHIPRCRFGTVTPEVTCLRGWYFSLIIISSSSSNSTKIDIAHMPDGKINRQIESEAHIKVDLTNV